MQTTQNQKVKSVLLVRTLKSLAILCIAVFPLTWTDKAIPQLPEKQNQSPSIPQTAEVKTADKQRLAETKIEQQQKQLAEDTAKLLELANELKADMDKTTKDTLSLSVVKKAEQVEKLAHKVRDEMKSSIGN